MKMQKNKKSMPVFVFQGHNELRNTKKAY